MAAVNDPKVTHFPVLYGERGALLWKLWVQDNKVFRTYGKVGGKLREPVARTVKGCNRGKSNETTDGEQAILYASRAWKKKMTQGYAPRQGDATQKNKNDREAGCFPMLASPFRDTASCLRHLRLAEGAFLQPKLDGIRCIARGDSNRVMLTSRTRKPFPWFEDIRSQLQLLWDQDVIPSDVALDGELYAHRLTALSGEIALEGAERFAAIEGASSVQRNSPSPFEPQLRFHVFDCFYLDDDKKKCTSQVERFAMLDQIFFDQIFLTSRSEHVQQVDTHVVFDVPEIQRFHDSMVEDGFEGVVIRARDLCYRSKKRSLKMRKYKMFDTDEFRIVNAKPGQGSDDGAVVWVCQQGHRTFACRPASNLAQRREQYQQYPTFIGSLLTVKYQGLSADGLPRFPVGLGIRQEFESTQSP